MNDSTKFREAISPKFGAFVNRYECQSSSKEYSIKNDDLNMVIEINRVGFYWSALCFIRNRRSREGVGFLDCEYAPVLIEHATELNKLIESTILTEIAHRKEKLAAVQLMVNELENILTL